MDGRLHDESNFNLKSPIVFNYSSTEFNLTALNIYIFSGSDGTASVQLYNWPKTGNISTVVRYLPSYY